MPACGSTCCVTTTWITARSRIRACRTGWRTCRRPASARCAAGSVSAPSPANRSAGRSAADARVAVDGVAYEVDPDLAGETVVLWWGLFDNELYVEHGDKRSGPYYPVGGPILLHRYRSHKKTRHEQRAERVEALAGKLELARAAVLGGTAARRMGTASAAAGQARRPVRRSRSVPGIYVHECGDAPSVPSPTISACRWPSCRPSRSSAIDATLARTMNKREIIDWVRQNLRNTARR